MIKFRLEENYQPLVTLMNSDNLLNSSLLRPTRLAYEELNSELFIVIEEDGVDQGLIRLDPVGPRMFNIHLMTKKQLWGRTEEIGQAFFHYLLTGYGPCLLIANIASKFKLAKRLAKRLGFSELGEIVDGIQYPDMRYDLTILYKKVI